MRAFVVCLAAACSLWACTASTTDPTTPDPAGASSWIVPADPEDTPAPAIEVVTPPTEAMLRAALDNDPKAMEAAAAAVAGCQASTTCPAQYSSCTAWSPGTYCGASCGPVKCICRPEDPCDGAPEEPKGRDYFNSYRICFDANQNACTQWNLASTTYCGC